MTTLRALLIVGLGAGLAGCLAGRPPAGVPVPPACAGAQPPLAADPGAAMVGLARAAWRAWGERVVELRPGAAVLTLPDGVAQPWEQERPAFARLADYWCAVPPHTNYWARAARAAGFAAVQRPDGSIDGTAFNRLAIGDSPFSIPWSAAFTSWLVWSAGIPAEHFRFSDTHWDYVADAMTAPAGSRAFVARPATTAVPRPGDLVCATRARPPPADWQRLLDGTRPMHCDLVVGQGPCAFAASGRCLDVIGGNVLQAVSLTRAALDTGGRLVPGQGRDWLVVLALTAGRAE